MIFEDVWRNYFAIRVELHSYMHFVRIPYGFCMRWVCKMTLYMVHSTTLITLYMYFVRWRFIDFEAGIWLVIHTFTHTHKVQCLYSYISNVVYLWIDYCICSYRISMVHVLKLQIQWYWVQFDSNSHHCTEVKRTKNGKQTINTEKYYFCLCKNLLHGRTVSNFDSVLLRFFLLLLYTIFLLLAGYPSWFSFHLFTVFFFGWKNH